MPCTPRPARIEREHCILCVHNFLSFLHANIIDRCLLAKLGMTTLPVDALIARLPSKFASSFETSDFATDCTLDLVLTN